MSDDGGIKDGCLYLNSDDISQGTRINHEQNIGAIEFVCGQVHNNISKAMQIFDYTLE